MNVSDIKISIIIPAKNESAGLDNLLPLLKNTVEKAEIIVINDGSADDTSEVCNKHGIRVITHMYSMGNGAAIKKGVNEASGEILIFMDADGQHNPDYIKSLVEKYLEGYDLVIGARHYKSHANISRWIGNAIYNRFASYMVNHKIEDLTSGFRITDAKKFKQFMHLYPNGFSYPTTSTMAYYRSGYSVAYVPIVADSRIGNSHIRLIKDGVRFLLIMFKIGTLFSPMKIFFPLSFFTFITGLSYYLYTYLTSGRFTNMSALLFICAVLIFLIGLVSEQITNLIYQHGSK